MNRTILTRRLCLLGLTALLTLSLCACRTPGSSGRLSTENATRCVQVELDTTYKGQFDGFVAFYSNVTTNDAKAQYDDNIEGEAAYFLSLIGLPDPEDQSVDVEPSEMQSLRARQLYKDIYAKSDYTIVSSSRQDDGTFAVKLTVRPMNILDLVIDNMEEALDGFTEKFSLVDTDSMSDEEFVDWYRGVYVAEYYDLMLDLLEEQIPNIGYAEEKSIVIQVQQDEDGSLFISNNDWLNLDQLIIDYNGNY